MNFCVFKEIIGTEAVCNLSKYSDEMREYRVCHGDLSKCAQNIDSFSKALAKHYKEKLDEQELLQEYARIENGE